MLFRKKQVISIDIGSSYTKVVIGNLKVDKGIYGVIVDTMFSVPTVSKEILENTNDENEDNNFGISFNDNELFQNIKKRLKEKGIKTKDIILTIPSNRFFTRIHHVPDLSEKEIHSMVGFELDDYLDGGSNNYEIDYIKIDSTKTGDGKTMHKLMIGALPKKEVKFYYNLLKKHDFNPIRLDSDFNSIRKIFENSPTILGTKKEFKEETVAIIDLGYANTNLNIMSKGQLIMNRSIDVGTMNIPTDYNEKSDAIERLSDQIERVFKFYSSNQSFEEITSILLVGGGSHLENIEEMLKDFFNVEVNIVKSLSNVVLSNPGAENYVQNYITTIASIIQLDKNDLNFFRNYIQKKLTPKNLAIRGLIILIPAVLITVAIVVPLRIMGEIDYAKNEIEELTLKQGDPEIDRISRELEDLEVKIANSTVERESIRIGNEYIKNNTLIEKELLETIHKSKPNEIIIDSININQNRVVITAKSINKEAISMFAYSLKLTDDFEDFFIPNIVHPDKDFYTFTIDFSIQVDEPIELPEEIEETENTEEESSDDVEEGEDQDD